MLHWHNLVKTVMKSTLYFSTKTSKENTTFVVHTHTTYTVIKKHEKLEGKGEASFDTTSMIQSHAESMKKIVGAL